MVRVGVVGGSIAGCASAIVLSRAGHDVTVHERSSGVLEGRGAGIGTPTSTWDSLVQSDLIGADTPRLIAADHLLASRHGRDDRYARSPLRLSLDMALLNWGDLWRALRARVPDGGYREAHAVSGARPMGDEVVLEGDGWQDTYDLVLFADGYRSLGRRLLFPDLDPSYRGYVLWRGILDEADLSESGPLESALYRLHYKGLPGNAVFYFVPGAGGETTRGERRVNWACYVPLPLEALPGFLVDRHGHAHDHSLPPGTMRAEEENRLKALMDDHLPRYFAEIVTASADTFAQPIYTVTVPANAVGRVGLLGDAGTVAQPFTGSGVFKAIMNAVDLVETLEKHGDVAQALGLWGVEQAARGRRLASLGRQMESAFVWDAPDFSRMTESEARSWWSASIRFPDEFRYVDEERG